jgi:hypothetical protein
MALTEAEALRAFRFLANYLREAELGWVINQVEEKLALGKVQTKKLPARKTPDYFEGFFAVEEVTTTSPRKGPAPLFAVAEEYSPHERLDVLLDSIVMAVPVVTMVAEKTFENLSGFGVDQKLEFIPEAEVTEPYTLEISAVRARAEVNARLLALINELRHGEDVANQIESPQ